MLTERLWCVKNHPRNRLQFLIVSLNSITMKKFLPIAMAAVMSMSAVAVSAVSANAVEPLNTPVQYAQVARASLATPKNFKSRKRLRWCKAYMEQSKRCG